MFFMEPKFTFSFDFSKNSYYLNGYYWTFWNIGLSLTINQIFIKVNLHTLILCQKRLEGKLNLNNWG